VNGLAGDEGGAFQEQDRVDDVLDFSHASDRMQVRKDLVSFGRYSADSLPRGDRMASSFRLASLDSCAK
jgi:hypothetical protein